MSTTRFVHAQVVQGAEGPCQDRAQILDLDDRVLLIVADGAGGTSGGAEAAELAVHHVVEHAHDLRSAPGPTWFDLFANVDRSIAASPRGGQTTLVLAVVDDRGVHGMSVGDSGAWLIGPTG